MGKLLLMLLILCGVPSALVATAQDPDFLIWNGKQYFILTNPLEQYFETHPEKRPQPEIVSSANWRGYVATWEVNGGMLTLKNVEILVSKKDPKDGAFRTGSKPVLNDLFPNQSQVEAKWFTGHIVVPVGKLVEYVHLGYGSTYKQYQILRVEKGAVKKQWKASLSDFQKFRADQFRQFKKTEEYQAELAKARRGLAEHGPESEQEIEKFMSEYFSERYISMVFDPIPDR
jgi:hypothetical protein